MTHLLAGDAVVAFSRRDVLMLRDQISGGHTSASSTARCRLRCPRREAERFAVGAADVLVATDAIGMGLNLPIRRVLFSTLTKFDGVGDRDLSVSGCTRSPAVLAATACTTKLCQRAQREAEASSFKLLRELLPKEPRAPRDFKAPVAPNWRHVQTIAQRMGVKSFFAVLSIFREQLKLDDAHFAVATWTRCWNWPNCWTAMPTH